MTARWRTREELVHQLVLLSRQGLSQRALARATGISRNTVKGLLARHRAAREAEAPALAIAAPRPRVPRASKLDAFAPRITELLARYSDITAQREKAVSLDVGTGGRVGRRSVMRRGSRRWARARIRDRSRARQRVPLF